MFRIVRGQSLSQLRRLFSTKYSDKYVMPPSEISKWLRKGPAKEPSKQQTLQKIDMPETEKVELKELVHGLPTTNQPFPVVLDEQEARITHQTPTQNLYSLLQLNALSSYEDYALSVKSVMHNEVDMYGDEAQPPIIADLEFKALLTPTSKYLAEMRKRYVINFNIPGSVENENPNSFLQLRPIEEFRHTPLIPIADSAMRKYKEMLEEYHRRAFVLQVSKESVINVMLFVLAAGICFYLIRQVARKEEEVAVSYQRLKNRRILGEDRPGSLL